MNFDRVKLYFISFNLYNFSNGLLSAFLNLFVLATASLEAVVFFNIFFYAGLEISYFATAYALDYMEPKDMYIIGDVIRAATLAMLILAAYLVSNVIIFGLLYGVSIGTFWLGNNILISDVSKGVDRRDFVYKNSIIGGVVGFIAPVLAGFMIEYSQFSGPLRFVYDFIAAIIVLLASAYVMHISKLSRSSKPIKFKFSDSIIKDKGYTNFKIYTFFWQMFAIPFGIILPVYVQIVTNSYVITGLYVSALVIVGIFSNYLAKLRYKYWEKFTKAGVVIMILSGSLLFIPQINPLVSIFLYSVVYTIFSTALNNQASTNLLEVIDSSAKDRMYFWINREYYITGGRAVSLALMAIIMVYFPNINLLVYLIPVMGLYCITYLKVSIRSDSKKKVIVPLNNGLVTKS